MDNLKCVAWAFSNAGKMAESYTMSKRNTHVPGRPASPEPPSKLVELTNSLRNPAVTKVGLTTTADGSWALMVCVRPGTHTPVKAVEEVCPDYPIVYQEEPDELPVARPAYPARGE